MLELAMVATAVYLYTVKNLSHLVVQMVPMVAKAEASH
jgi:hypothetical protein